MRYLRGNKECRSSGTFICVDTETTETRIPGKRNKKLHVLRLGHAISWRLEKGKQTRRQEYSFTTQNEFWGWVLTKLDKRRPARLYAHNAGFDMTVLGLWERIEDGMFGLKTFIDSDPPTIIGLDRNGKKLTVLDSLNYYRCSLAELGDTFQLQRGTVVYQNAQEEELRVYCRRDCEILERAVLGYVVFCVERDLGNLRSTAAEAAMGAYRHMFAPRKTIESTESDGRGNVRVRKRDVCLPLLHDDCDAKKLERDCYFGGECRTWFIGRVESVPEFFRPAMQEQAGHKTPILQGPCYHLDVNSLYPSVMAGRKYPCKLHAAVNNPTVDWLKWQLTRKEAVATVNLDSPEETFPIRRNGRVFYAKGRFNTGLAGEELRFALDSGLIRSVDQCCLYDTADLFTSYVTYFWELRQEYVRKGDLVHANLCKLFLNSLYGKFGQRNWEYVPEPEHNGRLDWGTWYDYDTHERILREHRCIAGVNYLHAEWGEHKDSFPAICACVTGAARMAMRRYRWICGNRNTLYQDSDSIHATKCGYDNLVSARAVDDGTLGKLRLVEPIDSAVYYGHKDYSTNGRRCVAGMPSTAWLLRESEYEMQEFAKIRSTLAEKPPAGVVVKTCRKMMKREYEYGIVGQDGWIQPITLPYAFNE
jgi:hypothetical protein